MKKKFTQVWPELSFHKVVTDSGEAAGAAVFLRLGGKDIEMMQIKFLVLRTGVCRAQVYLSSFGFAY